MSDHDNRAVWGDTYAGDRMRAKRVPDDNVLLSVDGADDVPLWTAKVMESSARGLCSILADLLGVELHAKGTAAKLQEQTTKPLPDDDCRVRVLLDMADDVEIVGGHADDQHMPGSGASCRARAHNLREAARHIRELESRVQELETRPAGAIDYERVRAEVPECAGLSDHQIDLCAAYMRFAHASKDDKAEVDCALHGRRSEAGILAAIDACRVAPEPEPEPESAPLRDHIEAAEAWLATCQGDASQWSTVQAVSTQAGAHALVDISRSLRGLREDLQALTATLRDAADTGVRVVTD